MSINPGYTYKITNAVSGTVIDLSGADNRSLIGYDWHGGDNQKWRLDRNDQGWTFRNESDGRYLAIDGNVDDGTPLVVTEQPFTWDIWPDEQDRQVFRIFVPNTKYNIDLADHGNRAPGTPVQLWYTWEGRNQTWAFDEA